MELRKSPFLIARLLEIMILASTIILVHNSFAQTYDTITKQREITKNNPQIQLGLDVGEISGEQLAADPNTNKIYAVNSGSNTVSIIDSDSGNVTTIPVGTYPDNVAVSSITNKIYVTNSASNDVSVINAHKEIVRIPVGTNPSDILTSYNNIGEHEKIYVTSWGPNNTVSVIDASTDKEIGTIPVGTNPLRLAESLKEVTPGRVPDKIYVANSGSNNVSVINASSDKVISTIPVGPFPLNIAVNPSTNKIYVATANDIVSVINASSDKLIAEIPVGKDPIAVNLSTNKIYVANSGSNNVSVINAVTDKEISRIPVGENPSDIEVSNVYPSISYVLNLPSNATQPSTISVIDDSVDKVAAGITFNIHPANSGGVWCNNKEYPTNIYLYVASDTKCIARPAKGFEFSGWVENLPHNSTIPLNQSSISDSAWNSFLSALGMSNDASATFDVNRFGTFTANFKALPPPIPPEYVATLFTVVATAFIGTWLTPALTGWSKTRTQRKYFKQCINQIGKLDKNSIQDKIIGYYADGKLSDVHHQLLKDKISEYYEKSN